MQISFLNTKGTIEIKDIHRISLLFLLFLLFLLILLWLKNIKNDFMKNLQHYFTYTFVVFFLLLGSQSLLGQDNRVYATAGIYYSLSYEREVYATENESKSIFLRAHGGNIQQVWYI